MELQGKKRFLRRTRSQSTFRSPPAPQKQAIQPCFFSSFSLFLNHSKIVRSQTRDEIRPNDQRGFCRQWGADQAIELPL
jgi:hypothetical protein